MTSFTESWKSAQERISTENGGVTFNTSANANVDLFFKIGAMRGQDVTRLYASFAKAFGENPYIATRILLWARDVRGGAGERKIFRDLLAWLEINNTDVLALVIPKIPELGRYDDLFVFKTPRFQKQAMEIYEAALRAKDGLAAKWMPREKSANKNGYHLLRKYLGLSPRQYRKVAAKLTDVVETKMCARDWENINYSHVPSVAQSRYKKAFLRHDPNGYTTYGELLVKAITDPEIAKTVKVNAGAVYPYDVIKGVGTRGLSSSTEANVIRAQWAALPNYMGDKSILPIVDVSGSMTSRVADGATVTCMDVAVSLGLYMASKNKGAFNNMFMTFSSTPELVTLKGDDIVNQIQQMATSTWGMSTDIDAALNRVLSHAVQNRVPQNEMPEFLIVLSDMEFNAAGRLTAYEKYVQDFAAKGYTAPKIIWWNIQSRQDQSPVKYNQAGAALVSGFSPSIVKSVLSGQDVTPESMMLKVIMNERYDLSLIQNVA